MTWGIPTDIFLDIHVALSLIALVLGLIVLYGLFSSEVLGVWTVLFLLGLILTSVTGFPLPPFGLDPPRMVGILSLVARDRGGCDLRVPAGRRLALDLCRYRDGGALLDAFVGVIQAFAKLTFLHSLAPTQSEPPFVIVQVIVMVIFVALGFLAVRRFHPERA